MVPAPPAGTAFRRDTFARSDPARGTCRLAGSTGERCSLRNDLLRI